MFLAEEGPAKGNLAVTAQTEMQLEMNEMLVSIAAKEVKLVGGLE